MVPPVVALPPLLALAPPLEVEPPLAASPPEELLLPEPDDSPELQANPSIPIARRKTGEPDTKERRKRGELERMTSTCSANMEAHSTSEPGGDLLRSRPPHRLEL
jgi:hypothetical protein